MEYVYIVKNSAFVDMVKIGRTRNITKRLNELNQIVPTPWEIVKTYEVQNSAYVENFIHNSLKHIRVRADREFFSTQGLNITASVDLIVADAAHYYLKQKYTSIVDLQSLDQLASIIHGTRIAKELTQRDLAKISGISIATLNRIENGQGDMSINTLLSLLHSMGCSVQIGLSADSDKKRQRVRTIYNTTTPKMN